VSERERIFLIIQVLKANPGCVYIEILFFEIKFYINFKSLKRLTKNFNRKKQKKLKNKHKN
jgi:hypothetical protein